MNDLKQLTKTFYKVVINFKDTLSLPTDTSLFSTFKYSCVLAIISLISSLLGFYTFVSWYGCLVCSLILLLLLFLERSENHALSEMYRTAQLRAQQIKRRAENASANKNVQRGTDSSNSNQKSSNEQTDAQRRSIDN